MTTQVLHPQFVPREDLDGFLARGWYRIGQTLMTCQFLLFNGALRSVVWTRLPLAEHRFTGGNRKLMARNDRRFRVTEGPIVLDEAREEVYQRYLLVAPGQRAASLRDLLYGESDEDAFETWEIAVWDGDRLAAFGWFDLGTESVQSLIGAYDPRYGRHSLGYYTLLLEVRWAQRRGLRYHYAGYVVPGDPSMDYKLRVGEVEYLDPDRGWRPWAEWLPEGQPTNRLHAALARARDRLAELGFEASVSEYPLFELPAWDPNAGNALDQPMVVECGGVEGRPSRLLVTYDLDRRTYGLVRCTRVAGWLQTGDGIGRPVEVWVVAERLGRRHTAEAIAGDAALRLISGLP